MDISTSVGFHLTRQRQNANWCIKECLYSKAHYIHPITHTEGKAANHAQQEQLGVQFSLCLAQGHFGARGQINGNFLLFPPTDHDYTSQATTATSCTQCITFF